MHGKLDCLAELNLDHLYRGIERHVENHPPIHRQILILRLFSDIECHYLESRPSIVKF